MIDTTPTLDLTPGNKILKTVIKDQLVKILNTREDFKNVLVYSEHTDAKKSNEAIYISTKSRSKESTGLDNYGGIEKGFSMLTRVSDIDTPGTSIKWASVDPRFYNTEESSGIYYLVIDDGFFSYLKATSEEETLVDSYDGVQTLFSLSEEPIDPSTVRVVVNELTLTRGVDFTVEGTEITLSRMIPPLFSIKCFYKVARETVKGIPFKKEEVSTMLPGVTLFFSDNIVIGDEMVLFLYKEKRPTYHVFSSRSDVSVSLLLSLGDKKEEDRLSDFIFSKLDLELRSFFQDCGWTMKDLSYSEDDREEWETGAYYSVANSTITMNISTEWARFVPLIKEFAGFTVRSVPSL